MCAAVDVSGIRCRTSAFGFFVLACCEAHAKRFPDEMIPFAEISRQCLKTWQTTLPADLKQHYIDLSMKDAERYEIQRAAVIAGHASRRAREALRMDKENESPRRKRKREKKTKDPNAPKGPRSAFIFFLLDKGEEARTAHPGMRMALVNQEMGKLWRSMTAQQRSVYGDKSRQDRDRYNKEIDDYLAKKQQQLTPESASDSGGRQSTHAIGIRERHLNDDHYSRIAAETLTAGGSDVVCAHGYGSEGSDLVVREVDHGDKENK